MSLLGVPLQLNSRALFVLFTSSCPWPWHEEQPSLVQIDFLSRDLSIPDPFPAIRRFAADRVLVTLDTFPFRRWVQKNNYSHSFTFIVLDRRCLMLWEVYLWLICRRRGLYEFQSYSRTIVQSYNLNGVWPVLFACSVYADLARLSVRYVWTTEE